LVAGSAVANGDRIFFAPNCSYIPSSSSASATAVLEITDFDFTDKTARFSLPTSAPLTDDDGELRTLAACFATSESLLEGASFLAYTTLFQAMTVIPVPRLGKLDDPGNVSVLSETSPDFNINSLQSGDLVFFKESSCNEMSLVYTNDNDINTTSGTGYLAAHGFENTAGKITLPSSPRLTSLSEKSARILKACFLPAGGLDTFPENIITLDDHLYIVPEPVPLKVVWHQHAINLLDFSMPREERIWSSGRDGDMFVLMRDDCNRPHLVSPNDFFIGTTHSGMVTLSDSQEVDYLGAVARGPQIAQGKLNEMNTGIYSICYAPKHTSGDSANDFKQLQLRFEILPKTVEGPKLSVPVVVPHGGDVVVKWYANIGYSSHTSQPGAWLGLYKQNDCNRQSETNLANLHKCYLAFVFLPEGADAGEVRFTVNEYKSPGLYEVRYFKGDSLDGQGQACRGIVGIDETYTQCVFEAAAVSSVFDIPGGDALSVESLTSSTDSMAGHIESIRDNLNLEKFRREII